MSVTTSRLVQVALDQRIGVDALESHDLVLGFGHCSLRGTSGEGA